MTARLLSRGFLVVPLVAAVGAAADPITVHVFDDVAIACDADGRGRVASRTIHLDPPPGPCRIIARVTTRPVPKDVQHVHDKWDRAAGVRLVVPPDSTRVEIVKYVTAYGGVTDHEVDVTRLAPILRGTCTIEAWIDTWVSPAWRVDVSLTYRPVSTAPDTVDRILPAQRPPPDWAAPVLFEPSVTRERMESGPITREVVVPRLFERLELHYLVSGHCTDGRGADEFVSKENELLVNGESVHRFRPWREDCRRFREINPYCRRWSDGSWSSDYDRSGWCPGDVVEPIVVNVTDAVYAPLRSGEDSGEGGERSGRASIVGTARPEIRLRIHDIRPRDADGAHGYWRASAVLVGWRTDPVAVRR